MNNIHKYIIISITVLFQLNSFGQDRTIDSLKFLLKNAKHDTTRCIILNNMIENEGDDNIWPQYNNQLKVLVEKSIANNLEPKKIYLKYLAIALNNIGYLTNQNGDIPKALVYYQRSINIQEEIGDKRGISILLNNIGYIYYGQGDISKALTYFHKSLKIVEEIGNKEGVAESLNNIGFIYYNQGDIPKALEYYQKSLKNREEIGDKKGIAISLNNIGLIYNTQMDIQKALECYQKSLKFRAEIGDKRGIAESLNNIGVNYKDQGDIEKALEYHHKSLKIREEIGDKLGITSSLNNIGAINNSQGNIQMALEYFHRSLKIQEEIDDKEGSTGTLIYIANLNLEKGQINEALVFANKGMQVSKELGFPENIKNSAKTLKSIFQKQNKYKEAFEMYELEIKMRDSINNQETQKATIKKQMQYQYETQAKELKNEQDKKDIQASEEKEKQKVITYSIFVGLILVLILALFIFRSYRQKNKANEIITLQKKEVESQKHLIEEKQKEIIDSINYAKRIQYALLAHDEFLKENLKEHFVYFNPKDIVSGDFYWATKKDEKFYLAVCDSTGHGVPGAFMSLLSIGFLNEAIKEKGIEKPNEVFNFVRQRLIDNISKEGQKDGFDGILICLDLKTKQITYAAANNKPLLMSNQTITELVADRMPVGMGERKEDFKLYYIESKPNDILYLYTDGYADQFGGPKGKKFKYKTLNELILNTSNKSLEEQNIDLKTSFETWRGDLEQVDDVCVIGIKI